MIKKNLSALFLTLASIAFALIICEIILRVKHNIIPNYDIEMWKYSRELKQFSKNSTLGHEHRPSSSATLQSVSIRINNQGIRGKNIGPKQKYIKRIQFFRTTNHYIYID